MANNFQINIVAVDKATAAIRKITQTLERVTKPIEKLKKNLGALSKEMGLDRIQASLVKVRRASESVAESFGKIVPSLATITSIASIAGIARLASSWGAFGMNLKNTADNIGISVQSLQELEGAAKYAGISTQALDSGLLGLSTTLQDAAMGRNNQAAQVMRNFGLELHRTADGSVDVKRALMDMAKIIPKLNANQQQVFARMFGIEQLLPLLRQGDKGIQEFIARAIASGNVMTQQQVKNAQKYQQSVVDMQNSMDGLSKSIGSTFIPVLQPMVDNLSRWIATHQKLVTTLAGGAVALSVLKIANSVRLLSLGMTADLVPALSMGSLKIALMLEKMGGLFGKVPGVGALLTRLSGVFLSLGAVIEATPVGWLLTAIAAIGAAVYIIYKNWDGISAWFSKKWQSVKDTFNGFKKWLFSLDLYEAGKHVADSLMQSLKRNLASWMPKSLQRFLGLDEWLGGAGTSISTGGAVQASGGNGAGGHGSVVNAPTGSGTIGQRFNNPGLLRSWGNTPRANTKSGYFAVFKSPAAGLMAMMQNLQGYGRKGYNTVGSIISHWAPGSENNTGAYIEDVASKTGLDPNARLNLSDPATLSALTSAIIRHENGGLGQYTPGMINQAAANTLHVQVDVKAAQGTHAKVSTKGSVNHTSRVAYAMEGPA